MRLNSRVKNDDLLTYNIKKGEVVMKKKYERPMAYEESFVANEYITACWGVACSIDAANEVDHDHRWQGVYHQAEHCGLATNQHISTDSNGIAVSMREDNTDGLDKFKKGLICTLYTDDSYKTKRDYSTVHTGDYIYWTTKADTRTWHHQGRVQTTYQNRPNHS